MTKRKGNPSVLEALGLSVSRTSMGTMKVIAADKRTQRINDLIASKPKVPTRIPSLPVNRDVSDLHRACRQGLRDDVEFLLSQNPDLGKSQSSNSEDGMGTGASAVHFAIMGNNPDIIHYLVSKGADVNQVTDRGTSPLHIACTRGMVECAQALLQSGASLLVKDSHGVSPMTILHQDCGDPILRKARGQILSFSRKTDSSRSIGASNLLQVTDRFLYNRRS